MTYTRQAGNARQAFGETVKEIVTGAITDGILSFYLTSDGTQNGDQLYADGLITSVCVLQTDNNYTTTVVSDDASGEFRVEVWETGGGVPPDGIPIRVSVDCVPL